MTKFRDYEYNWREIATALNLTRDEVKKAYVSGMRKIEECPSFMAEYLRE